MGGELPMSTVFDMSQALNFLTLPRVGLLYDIVGALILGWESLYRPPEIIRHESALFWRAGLRMRDEIKTSVDTQVGFSLLALGFLFQLSAGTSLEPLHWIALLFFLGLMAFLVFYLRKLRKWCITRKEKQIGPIE